MDYPTEWVVEALLDRFPEWRTIGWLTRDASCGVVTLEVPAPASAAVDVGLIIEASEQIIVRFDEYHEHFEPEVLHAVAGGPAAEGLDFASATFVLVEGIVAERIVALSYWKGTACGASRLMRVDRPPPPGSVDWTDFDLPWASSFTRIRIRSWRGTHNRELERPDRPR